jgi:hypothetical protein
MIYQIARARDYMAKTTTTIRKVDIVDLIRNRKSFPLLDVPAIRVTVNIEITSSGLLIKPAPVPSAKLDRLEKAARDKLDEYEDIITKEAARFSKKIEGLLQQGQRKQADAVTSEVNASIKNALRSAEGAAEQAVEAAKKKESQGDKLLTEARVKTTVKVVFSGVSLATNAAKLAGTMGADVTSYFSIAKTLISLGLEIKQQLKGEGSLRKDLVEGMSAYLDLRSSSVMQAAKRFGVTDTSGLPGFPGVFKALALRISNTAKEVTKGKDKSAIAKELLDFTIKMIASKFSDVEKARQMYRNHTTKMRHSVDSVSAGADKLMAAMKKAPNLKQGVQIGAECMKVKGNVRKLAGQLDECIAFLSSVEATMKGFGLECDDRTIIDKIKALDKMTIAAEGAGLVSNLSSIYSLCSAVAALA